ncbi:MAG: hypothetical protein GX557_13835 [Chloroflexi bacterium]|nr:hypothetical protein [Chloroflexota bacterium]
MRIMRRVVVLSLMCLLLLVQGHPLAAQEAQPDGSAPEALMPLSVFPSQPPVIDGTASSQEWGAARHLALSAGALYAYNDAAFLYLLVDVFQDTARDDPDGKGTPDFFSVSFDVNRDGLITPGVDMQYTLTAGQALCRQFYLGPGSWTVCASPHSLLGIGFGASPASRTPHRFWELAISLKEIGAAPGTTVRMGVRQYSRNPGIDVLDPPSFTSSFASLKQLTLVSGSAQLLVLADQSFLNALAPLKAHKEHTGLSTYVQSWQQLNAAFYDQGRDEAERVKRAIAAYEFRYGTYYVMLVGDSNRFPVRYHMTDRGDAAAYNRAFYPTDLYYADLYEPGGAFETWDSNANGYYGELHGETIPGTVNIDNVDLVPDIAVGRVPATSAAQVTTYVNKIITYEFGVYNSAWAKRTLSVATNDWIPNACQTKQNIIANSLAGYTNYRLYQSGNPCVATDPPTSANINAKLNTGVRFMNYVGHGNTGGLAISGDAYTSADLAGLSNANTLPIAFAMACDTARYATLPPYDAYTDVYGAHHTGTTAGETFTSVPPQPAALQPADNPSCFGESFLLASANGGIGFVGCVTGSQAYGRDLDEAFFESLDYGHSTLGGMWNSMEQQYYVLNPVPATIDPPNWELLAEVAQPWKFNLFGDPSLRINGVSHFQPADFAGDYTMNHDGWRGTLSLEPRDGDYIEGIPNLGGSYTPVGGTSHNVRGQVREWDYPIPTTDWPDHMTRFYIDFADTPSTSDDQRFDGYLFTHDKSVMAGITWYGSTPYGFYAREWSMLTGAPSSAVSAGPDVAPITKADFVGRYVMNHDGWLGKLELWSLRDSATLTVANIGGTYTDGAHHVHAVYGHVRTAGHPVPGPDHKITFYVDLADSASTADDQRFEGYLFTQDKSAIAGLTWWHDTPFGFYALREHTINLPLVRRP